MVDVGIIIPAHNAAWFLPQTIKSVRDQTFTDWACVIVDDCSLDSTREVAAQCCCGDARFSFLSLDQNCGTSAARNAGLAALRDKTRYLIFLDSDDVWNLSALQILFDAMERQPAWVAVHGNCRLIDHDGVYVGGNDVETASRETFDYRNGQIVRLIDATETTFCQFLLRNPVVSPGCLLIRAEAITKITQKAPALFNAEMTYAEDLDAWFRLRIAGCVGHVDKTILDYRRHGQNKSKKRIAMALHMRKVRVKALSSAALDHHEREQGCLAFRTYRRDRMVQEIRSSVSVLRTGRIRAGAALFFCAILNGLDVLMVLILQLWWWAHAATTRLVPIEAITRDRTTSPDVDCIARQIE